MGSYGTKPCEKVPHDHPELLELAAAGSMASGFDIIIHIAHRAPRSKGGTQGLTGFLLDFGHFQEPFSVRSQARRQSSTKSSKQMSEQATCPSWILKVGKTKTTAQNF